MRTMTVDEAKMAWQDPAWASKLTEPVEIIGLDGTPGWATSLDAAGSEISHLSPLLHVKTTFSSFSRCKSLKKAEGHFSDFVDFEQSGIEEVGELQISTPHTHGVYCDLSGTPFARKHPLKAAEIMAGSKDVKVWETIRKAIEKNSGWINMHQTLKTAILTLKVGSLRNETPFEI
jgi:hypothetical protein